MTYTIQIDQSHSIEWGLNLSEATLFSFCYNLPAWAETAVINNQVWYFASRNKAIEEMPLITDKPDTVYRLYRALQSKGLIEWQKIGVKDYVRLTDKAKEWNSEKNPSDGKKSESTRKKIRATSENFPTYNNTIDNSTIDIESTLAQFHVQVHSLETIPTVEGEVPRPAARPTSKISDVQANPNAFSDAAEYFLRLIEAKKYDLGNAAKYAVPYFRHKQQTGKWIALCLPSGIQEEQRWLGEHMAGVRAWADNQVQFDRNNGTQPTAPAAPVQIRREI